MPNCFEAYFIDELIGTFSSKVEAAAELLLHARRGSGKSPKLTSYVLCSRDAAFPSRRIIALVGYNNRNSQGLLRLADLSRIGARLGVFVNLVACRLGPRIVQPSLCLVDTVERNDGNSLWHRPDIGRELAA